MFMIDKEAIIAEAKTKAPPKIYNPMNIPEHYFHFSTASMKRIISEGVEEGSGSPLVYYQYPYYMSAPSWAGINATCKLLYTYIKNFDTTIYKGCIMTNLEIGKEFGWSDTTVKRSLKILLDHGKIKVSEINLIDYNTGKDLSRHKGISTKSKKIKAQKSTRRLLQAVTPTKYNPKKKEGPDFERKYIAVYRTAVKNILTDMPFIPDYGIVFLCMLTGISYQRLGRGYVANMSYAYMAELLGVSMRTFNQLVHDLENWGIIGTETIYLNTDRNLGNKIIDAKLNSIKFTMKVNILDDGFLF